MEHCIDHEKMKDCASKKLDRKTFFSFFLPLILGSYIFGSGIYLQLAAQQKAHEKYCDGVTDGIQGRQNTVQTNQNINTLMFEQIEKHLDDISSDTKAIKEEVTSHEKRLLRIELQNQNWNNNTIGEEK